MHLYRTFVFVVALLLGYQPASIAHAQQATPDIPDFWDKHLRFPKPDTSKTPRLRFLTTTDFPPFNFIDRKKRLTGFHVELAREICEILQLIQRCQIQAVPWEELIPMIEKGDGEAIIAGVAISAEARQKLDFTHEYLQIPARFITRKQSGVSAPVYAGLFRRTTGVIEGSAHAEYFKSVFAARSVKEYKTRELALAALQQSEIDAVFSDGMSLSFWLASPGSKGCCTFVDGAFQSREFFGNGMSVAVKKDNVELKEMLNFALAEINRNGKFAEFYRRYFPLGLF